MAAHNAATHFSFFFLGYGNFFRSEKPYLLALAGQPSLLGYDAFVVYRVQGAFRRICRQNIVKPLFLLLGFFLFSQNSNVRFWGLILWLYG